MDKKSYAFGMSVASSFYQQGIHVANVEDFLKGLKDMLTGGKLELSMDEAGEALEAFYKELEEETSERAAAAGAAAKEEGEKFLAQMAKDPQVKATGSGLKYQWYYQKPGSSSWAKITKNGTAATYTVTTKKSMNGYKYMCKILNGMGSVKTKAVKLTVK